MSNIVEVDLRQTKIGPLNSASINTPDLRLSETNSKEDQKSQNDLRNNISMDVHQSGHNCPGHYVKRGGLVLFTNDSKIFTEKNAEINVIINSLGNQLKDMGIMMSLHIPEDINVIKCSPPVVEPT
jgi:hypothetical protein